MVNYLDDVAEDNAFVLGDKKIKNLYALLFELRSISDEQYSHYAAEHHNYFADWIEHVLAFLELSSELRNTNNKAEAIGVLEKKIESLNNKDEPKKEEPVEKETPVEKRPEPKKEKKIFIKKPQPKKETKPKEDVKKEEPQPEVNGEDEHKKFLEKKHPDELLGEIAKNEKEIKDFLWKHFAWDMAKEFMYGMAIGILIGFVLSKILLR